ncbi:hypothetical protein T11_11220 [Trichinella zimbabwensis]|uniref:Uncharacterized protein n=1 Tax=Trichinella zimbabwensis TaxID=268475 RepID=A0A0V1H767_9BILA|nr:hypothetical protein T11_11220 [Trichinella zimbabwensis]
MNIWNFGIECYSDYKLNNSHAQGINKRKEQRTVGNDRTQQLIFCKQQDLFIKNHFYKLTAVSSSTDKRMKTRTNQSRTNDKSTKLYIWLRFQSIQCSGFATDKYLYAMRLHMVGLWIISLKMDWNVKYFQAQQI